MTIDVILWRHCEAEPGVPDEARRLTARGVKQSARMAAWLAARLPERCRILVSPAVRAQQTAQALQRPFATVAEIGTASSVAGVLAAAQWRDAHEPVLIVGHQPTLGLVGSFLLTGEAVDRPMSAGAVWWIAPSTGDDAARGKLKFAVTPDST